MMFFNTHNYTENFEEEEEDDEDVIGIDDALLGELDDDAIDDELLLGEELTPLIKDDPFAIAEEDHLKADEGKLYGEDEEEEEDAEYDSFDDRDEM